MQQPVATQNGMVPTFSQIENADRVSMGLPIIPVHNTVVVNPSTLRQENIDIDNIRSISNRLFGDFDYQPSTNMRYEEALKLQPQNMVKDMRDVGLKSYLNPNWTYNYRIYPGGQQEMIKENTYPISGRASENNGMRSANRVKFGTYEATHNQAVTSGRLY